MGTGSFPGAKSDQGVTLAPHPLLVPWSRKSRAICLPSLWAVRPVKGCTFFNCTNKATRLRQSPSPTGHVVPYKKYKYYNRTKCVLKRRRSQSYNFYSTCCLLLCYCQQRLLIKHDLLAITLKVCINAVELHSSVFWSSISPITRARFGTSGKILLTVNVLHLFMA